MRFSFSQFVRRFRSNLGSRRRNLREPHSAEVLEPRRLLATLVNAKTLSYQDIDGDSVTVKFSKPILTNDNVNSIFTFSSGAGAVNGSNAIKEALHQIQLTGDTANSTTITTTAIRSTSAGGDGFANLGELLASGIQLGAIKIDGDLGRVVAGVFTSSMGLNGLTVRSIGLYGTNSGAQNMESLIQGKLSSLTVSGSIRTARFIVSGSIGNVTIGGSLIGGSTQNSGLIFADSAAGAVVAIGGDIVGSTALGSGRLQLTGAKSVTVGGSVKGANGEISGTILGVDLGSVTVKGNVEGGSGKQSGRVASFGGPLTSVTINGSLVGGIGEDSGTISSSGDLGQIKIGGDVVGGVGSRSGSIKSSGKIAGVSIIGSLIGGDGSDSGRIESSSDLGSVKIGLDLLGGNGTGTGTAVIFSDGKLGNVTVGGSLRGGSGNVGAEIISTLDAGVIKIGGSLIGTADSTAAIESDGKIASVTIGGSLIGGGSFSGRVLASGEIMTVSIAGDIVGGSTNAGSLISSGFVGAGQIKTLTLGGSLIAGFDGTSGTFRNNGAIRIVNDLGTVLVRGNLIGNVTNPAIISARGKLNAAAGTADVAIASLRVNGSVERGLIQAGVDRFGADANADAQITTLKVLGDWIASSVVAGTSAGMDAKVGTGDDVKMSGAGVKNDAVSKSKIGTLTIGGQAFGSVGGGDHFGFTSQEISKFTVGDTTIPLTAGSGNDAFFIGITSDLRLLEIA